VQGGSTAYKQQTADIHQCYRPNHDIVIPPPVKSTRHKSPTLQALASNQTTLFFFGGDARLPGCVPPSFDRLTAGQPHVPLPLVSGAIYLMCIRHVDIEGRLLKCNQYKPKSPTCLYP
jgi:hypothetical protein